MVPCISNIIQSQINKSTKCGKVHSKLCVLIRIIEKRKTCQSHVVYDSMSISMTRNERPHRSQATNAKSITFFITPCDICLQDKIWHSI